MTATDFVAAFCGPDRTALETYEELGCMSDHHIVCEMLDSICYRDITEPNGETITDLHIGETLAEFRRQMQQ